jgi:hypothetical protein
VWIYTQSNITQASYSPEYITPTQQISRVLLPATLFNIRDLKLRVQRQTSGKEKIYAIKQQKVNGLVVLNA